MQSTLLAFTLAKERTTAGCILGQADLLLSTVGTDEEVVRKYIREQEKEDKRVEQLIF